MMQKTVKYTIRVMLLGLLSSAAYLYADDDEKVTVKQAVLAQTELFEGPHLVYQDGKAKLISAVADAGKMKLVVKNIEKPKQIEVYKPGEQPVRFKVPIKSKIVIPTDIYFEPEKMFVISDVEGNFNVVTGLLSKHKVIDKQLNWTFGNGHLVIIGDVFDRGNHVTELLWLLYKLEGEAQTRGGKVHMLIGNHEMMNLQNDLRYVEPKYSAFGELLEKQLSLSYVDLFRENTELGKWLRSKNIVEKIGDTLFTHGGMSPVMVEAELSLLEINTTMRLATDTPKAKRSILEKLLFGRNGPIWYRGYFMELPLSPKIDKPQLTNVLNYYGAKSIAVGHTIVDKPKLVFDGQVIAVDVKHPADHLVTSPARVSYGVLFEGGKVFVVDDSGGVVGI
jgi:hypothetical protein